MSWNLTLSYVNMELLGTVTPPSTSGYALGNVLIITDPQSPYLDGVTLDNYAAGDYIRVLVVDYNEGTRNNGTIKYKTGLFEAEPGDEYAHIVVYDSDTSEAKVAVKTSKKVTNSL